LVRSRRISAFCDRSAGVARDHRISRPRRPLAFASWSGRVSRQSRSGLRARYGRPSVRRPLVRIPSRPVISGRSIVVTVGLVSGAIIAGGFAAGLDGFGGNILAELAGIGLGFFVAFFVLERLLAAQRQAEWSGTRQASLRALRARLFDIALATYLHVDAAPGSILEADAGATDERADAFVALATYVQGRTEHFAKDPDDEAATTRLLHTAIHDDVAHIRDVLVPRFLALADDPALLELLLDLDEAEREWSRGVIAIYDDWGFPNELAWERAAAAIASAAALYRYVAADLESQRGRWTPAPSRPPARPSA
jgi:hypothetical protein